jgi:hypothetical protein
MEISMPQSDEILKKIDSARYRAKDLAREYDWDAFDKENQLRLLKEAKRRATDSTASDELPRLIYKLSSDSGDYWVALQILGCIAIKPNSPSAQTNGILKTMRSYLDKFAESVRDELEAERYGFLQAQYRELFGKARMDQGDLQTALEYYKNALADYQEMEFAQGIQRVQKTLSLLDGVMELVPAEALEDATSAKRAELSELSQQVARLQSEHRSLIKALDSQQEAIASLQATRSELASEIERERMTKTAVQKALREEKHALVELQRQFAEAKVSLEFLLTLSQANTAPLWVEVLKLALEQGEIDELAVQALERLAVNTSTDVLPVIVEIAARLPEPFALNADSVEETGAKWLALIAEAKSAWHQEDVERATSLMVDAWDTFLRMPDKEAAYV